MEWWKKVVNFIKEAWAPIVIILSSIFGFIIGRQSLRRAVEPDRAVREHINNITRELESERRTIEQLRERLSESESTIGELEGNNSERLGVIQDQRKRIDKLETDLSDAERIINIARRYHADTGAGIDGVDKLTERLRDTISKHRIELEKIKVDKPVVDGSSSN